MSGLRGSSERAMNRLSSLHRALDYSCLQQLIMNDELLHHMTRQRRWYPCKTHVHGLCQRQAFLSPPRSRTHPRGLTRLPRFRWRPLRSARFRLACDAYLDTRRRASPIARLGCAPPRGPPYRTLSRPNHDLLHIARGFAPLPPARVRLAALGLRGRAALLIQHRVRGRARYPRPRLWRGRWRCRPLLTCGRSGDSRNRRDFVLRHRLGEGAG